MNSFNSAYTGVRVYLPPLQPDLTMMYPLLYRLELITADMTAEMMGSNWLSLKLNLITYILPIMSSVDYLPKNKLFQEAFSEKLGIFVSNFPELIRTLG